MSLEKYHEKRDFKKTREPEGKVEGDQHLFVIQKHDAQNLHYDLRLSIGGVLVSWAVPKGLSTAAHEKRLGIRTEDHPMEYADFEGVIPEGEYGAGTVMVWDKGAYEVLTEDEDPDKSLQKGLKDGSFKVELKGEKLKGGYAFARMDADREKEQWLIFKLDDSYADARRNPVSTEPKSVLTGRSLDEIKKEEISHPDKVLFQDAGITKEDLARYYERIAEYMLPHIKGRPLTLRQFTEGIGKEGFYSKHAPDHFPDFIQRLTVPMRSKSGKTMKMVMADAAADLVYFAGQNTIELHMGLSASGALEKPDQVIFDLDPSDDDFEKVRKTAFALKKMLDEQEITSFVKTTGSKGVHIHIPLRADRKFEEVKAVARKIAEKLNRDHPDLTTIEQRKDKRGDRVFIDYLRNDYGMTAIAPYSLRALKNAPVATPIDWAELKDTSLGPQTYTLSNIFRRLSQKKDPWKGFYRHKIHLKSLQGPETSDT